MDEFMKGFVYNPACGQKDKQRLGCTGKIFDFAMTEGMILICGFIRIAYGPKSDKRSYQINAGMYGLGQHRY